MALPIGLNDLAKLTLLASDTSYFKSDLKGSWLAALPDTPYGIAPLYTVSQEYKAIDQWVDPATGFGVIIYKKDGATPADTEIIVALRGTDGPNPQDWVANSQFLGWNQWQGNRDRLFNVFDSLRSDPLDPTTAFEGTIHFTGQSLGGGLAQYAAYEYVQSRQNLTGFSKANITLTTFNGFGGVLALDQNLPGDYDPDILGGTGPNAIGSNAHFYTEGDLVSRLGSLGGLGHTGGTTYFLNAHAREIDPDTGEPFLLNFVDAHRIETGFYPFLAPGVEFEAAVARPIDYLPMQNVQQLAALYGRVANDQDVSPVESLPRLVAGLIAGLSLGNPTETNALAQAVFTNLHSAGQMSDEWYVCLRKYDWGAIAQTPALVAPGPTGAAYGLSLLAAVLSDALEFQVERHVQLFNTLRDWVSSAVQTSDASISSEDRRVQAEMLLALVPGAVIGSKVAPLLQPLALDINEFAQEILTTGASWAQEIFSFLRDKVNTAGGVVGSFVVKLASTFVDVALDCGMTATSVQSYLDTVIVPMILDTANGVANAVSEFVQDIPNTLFNFGRTISNLADIQLIDQAYAAELKDPRLSSSIRAAAEDARDIVQRAGQTVVISKGVGVNLFGTPGFDPNDPGLISTATVPEGQLQAYTLALPFDAGTGGQRVQLQLSGVNVSALRVRAGGVELTPQDGLVTLTVPEGQRQIVFGLHVQDDVDVDGGLTLSATLVDVNGIATHTTHQEATLTVDATVEGTITYNNGLPSQTIVGDNSANTFGPLGGSGAGFNVTAFGNGGDDFIVANTAGQGDHQFYGGTGADFLQGALGHDRLYGEAGRDILIGFEGDDVLEGGDQEDALSGGLGDDVLDGGTGDDSLTGNGGADVLRGDLGADLLAGDAVITALADMGDDSLDGGAGNDWLFGFLGDDVLDGGTEDDHLYGDTVPAGAPSVNAEWPGLITPVAAVPFSSLTGGDDYLNGGAGADYLQGDAGDDILFGGADNDELVGDDLQVGVVQEGADWLEGEGGNDTLIGGGGEDALFGGRGDDLLVGDYANNPTLGFADTLDGGDGNDELQGGGGDDQLDGGFGNDLLFGEAGDDDLFGGADVDELQGGDGHDVLFGGTENDRLFGQVGNDELDGGDGDDLLVGDIGDDTIFGGEGNDQLNGGAGTNLLVGEAGNDIVLGGSDADLLFGDEGDDHLEGGGGSDELTGGTGSDTLVGEAGADTYVFTVGDGSDTIIDTAGEGNLLVFGPGVFFSDVVLGQAPGALIVYLNLTGDQVYVQGFDPENPTQSAGIDQFAFADGTTLTQAQLVARGFDLTGTEGDDFLDGGETYRKVFGLNGNDLLVGGLVDNLLDGGAGDDRLIAVAGVDRLLGGSGNDWLDGGDGVDSLDGGEGNDLLIGGLGEDTILFGRGSGQDTLDDQSFSTAEINTVQLGADILSGDVRVNAKVDESLVLSINGTSDQLTFQSFFTNPVNQTYRVLFGDGLTWDVSELVARAEGITVFGTPGTDFFVGTPVDDHLYGLDGDDVLEGRRGADTLIGGEGNDELLGDAGGDTMIGGPGDDIYRVEHPGDMVIEAAGEGIDRIRSEISLALGPNIEHLKLEGFVSLNGVGNELDNVLEGTPGNNVLEGGEGNDTLVGRQLLENFNGDGNDVLRGGAGNDTYIYGYAGRMDIIEDTSVAGAGNRIQFGFAINLGSLTFIHDEAARTLTIQLEGSAPDQLVLANFDPSGRNGSLVVETLAFTDGSTVSMAELFPATVNHAPTVANPIADQVVQEGTPLTLQGPADMFVDSDAGDVLTYSASQADGTALPSWLSFDATTRTFSGIPDDAQVGSLDLRVTATDTGSLSVSDVFALTVTNVNEAPTVTNLIADQTTLEDAPFSFTVPANTIADQDVVHGDTLTYSATQADGSALPSWLKFDPATRTFSGTPFNDDVGALDLWLTATDSGNLTTSNTFTLTVQNVNDAPTPANPIADQAANTGTAFTFTVAANTFADVDVGDTLTCSATRADGTALPAWLAFDPTTRTFSGTPADGDAGLLTLRVTATDSGSLSVDDLFDVTVTIPDRVLTGTAGNDVLTGGAGNDQLFGLAGNDTLNGGAGHDLLDGGTGTDTMGGGIGDDAYVVNQTGDVVTELANEGIDTVQSAITYTLGTNVENLILTGTTAINGTGNALDNVLTGNSANNTLIGGAGNDRLDGGLGSDTMVGGIGNDTYVVNHVGDVVSELFDQGIDTIESSVSVTLGTNVENLILTGTASINGTGSSANNVLMGNSGHNILGAGSGNDTVDGGAGDDTVQGGSGHDWLSGGDGIDRLDGGSGDDQLFGGASADTMIGGSGADAFTGGTGNDTLTGNSGNDVYNFSRGDGQDTIIDSDPFIGNQDRAAFGATIDPLDLVISRQANDLRLTIHGSTDQVTVKDWYLSTNNLIETIQAGNGEALLGTQVDQLIQAMAQFSQQTGLTWDQAIDQRPQEVQTVLAASWQ